MSNTGWQLITLSESETATMYEQIESAFSKKCMDFHSCGEMASFVFSKDDGSKEIIISPKLAQVSPFELSRFGAVPWEFSATHALNFDILTSIDDKKAENLLRS